MIPVGTHMITATSPLTIRPYITGSIPVGTHMLTHQLYDTCWYTHVDTLAV